LCGSLILQLPGDIDTDREILISPLHNLFEYEHVLAEELSVQKLHGHLLVQLRQASFIVGLDARRGLDHIDLQEAIE